MDYAPIVLFSEGAVHHQTNAGLLYGLAQKYPVSYLTLDPLDPFLVNPPPNVTAQYLKIGLGTWLKLSKLKAGLFLTTTPGLNSLALKRSAYVKHYSYYLHSPGDLHWYQKYSFDSFDSICCSSPYQLKTLEAIEATRIYGFSYLKEQRSVQGVAYYDHYALQYQKETTPLSKKPCVLLATNWGWNNYLNYLSYDIFQMFLNEGYDLIFRPHPQSLKTDAKLISDILAKYQKHPGFRFDTDINFVPSLKASHFLISAASGLIFDYALLAEKPVLTINFPRVDQAHKTPFEGDNLSFLPWEEEYFYPQLGSILSSSDDTITSKLSALNVKDIQKNIQSYKKEIHNFGQAVPALVRHYLKLAESLDV